MRKWWNGRARRSIGVLVVAAVVAVAACSDDDDSAATTTASAGAPATTGAGTTPGGAAPSTTAPGDLPQRPVAPVPPLLDEAKVQQAVDSLDDIVGRVMDETGVPGIAVAVVYKDEVVLAKGYGVRKVGEPETVDADTVFQVASVSKPVATTIVAGVVGDEQANWTAPVKTWNPEFKLKDPYVTDNATLQDLLSHRSGLPNGGGDLLEDLGWDREYILSKLDQLPLHPFRAVYDYSNFGITEGGVAAADAAGVSWEDLADSVLFERIGMDSSSYRHADYEAQDNKALIHVPVGAADSKQWEAKYVRDADAEAPAGGLSTSVNDMAKFMRLQLGDGTFEGTEIIDAAALQQTHLPHQELHPLPTDPAVRTGFYGLGWNVGYDDHGRVKLDHSGAFNLGAATTVSLLPGEDLGIVTLTNGQPHGYPEAINNTFIDVATDGAPQVDWLAYYAGAFQGFYAATTANTQQWSTPPADPEPAAADSAYVGTYQNSYYGPLTVTSNGTSLSMTMGPEDKPTTFALSHFDGNTFTYQTIGENGVGPSNAVFDVSGDDVASSVELPFYAHLPDTSEAGNTSDTQTEEGLGLFTRQ